MFCDLVDSTRLAGELDPEDMRDVVVAYQRACAGAIAAHSGFLARYLGDGVLAYFGYPEAHEDDARLAVAAGLAVVDAVAALGARFGRDDLQVRIGVHTGEVVVTDAGDEASRQPHEIDRRDAEHRGAPAVRRLARNRGHQRRHPRPRGGLLRCRQHRRADAQGHPPPGLRVPCVAATDARSPARRRRGRAG